MALKTDFKDDIFEGNRKYKLSQDGEGNTEIQDVTAYSQEGDIFTAEHINATNEAVNRLNSAPIRVPLAAAGWTGESAPYIQTVQAQGIMAEDTPLLVSQLADGAPLDVQQAYSKAYSIVAAGTGTCGAGTATFKVYKKPATDIIVGLKV